MSENGEQQRSNGRPPHHGYSPIRAVLYVIVYILSFAAAGLIVCIRREEGGVGSSFQGQIFLEPGPDGKLHPGAPTPASVVVFVNGEEAGYDLGRARWDFDLSSVTRDRAPTYETARLTIKMVVGGERYDRTEIEAGSKEFLAMNPMFSGLSKCDVGTTRRTRHWANSIL